MGRRRIDRRTMEVILCLAIGLPLTALAIATRIPYPIEKLTPPPRARPAWVPLDRVAPIVIQATLAGEDHRFHEHEGVDGAALLRALWLAASHRRVMSGGSTITMQLVRLVEPHPKTLPGKLGEMVDACRLERAVSKTEILEQYLNRAYYGNGAWGIEAAALRYFGKPAAQLTAGEGTLLAVLPRAPLGYDPYRHRAEALARRSQVLALMEKRGWIDGVGRVAAESQTLVLATPRRQPLQLGHLPRWPATAVDLESPGAGQGIIAQSSDPAPPRAGCLLAGNQCPNKLPRPAPAEPVPAGCTTRAPGPLSPASLPDQDDWAVIPRKEGARWRGSWIGAEVALIGQ